MPDNENRTNVLELPLNGSNLNVGFKLGLQSTVNQMIAADKSNDSSNNNYHKAVHGTFYLTQDTHRLYVGNADNTLSAVNLGVIFVSDISGLPTLNDLTSTADAQELLGQFYYIIGSNILCVASGSRWVQINPDTSVDSFDYTFSTVSNVSTDVPNASTEGLVNYDIKQAIKAETILHQTSDPLNNGGIKQNVFIATASSNLHVSTNTSIVNGIENHVIKLSCDAGDTYTLETSDYEVNNTRVGTRVDVMNSVPESVGHFILIGDDTNTLVPVLDEDELTHEMFIRITGGVGDYNFDLSPVESNNLQTGELQLTLEDTKHNSSLSLRVDPTITIGENSDVVNHFTHTESGGLISLNTTLDVYTTSEVDRLIERASNTANAMYFAGILDDSNGRTLNSIYNTNVSNYSNGATFKIALNDITKPQGMTITGLPSGKSLAVGDLIILQGQEYQDTVDDTSTSANPTYVAPNALDHDSKLGKLVPGTVTYQYIPSGDDIDMYHNLIFNENSNSVKFLESVGGALAVENSLIFDTLTSGAISIDHDNSLNGLNKTIHIDHASIQRNDSTGTAINGGSGNYNYDPSFTILTGVSSDSYGHITGVTTQTINIKSPYLELAYMTSSQITNGIALSNNIKLSNDSSALTTSAMSLTSTSLSVTGTAGSLATPTAVTVDLVWGAF